MYIMDGFSFRVSGFPEVIPSCVPYSLISDWKMMKNKRMILPLLGFFFAAPVFAQSSAAPQISMPETASQWGVYELKITGCTVPFEQISATFTHDRETKIIPSFADGDSVRRIRFMPSFQGKYSFEISGLPDGMKSSGLFTVSAPEKNMHGPVSVRNKHHFAHADGTPFYPVGTTCYAWLNQPEKVRRQTVETLSNGYFNKIRFCVFPKHYLYNQIDPEIYPFERLPNVPGPNNWDYSRPNPAYFAVIDQAVSDLAALGIEADIILFHPYDKWGFSEMPAEANDFYLKYMIARYSAFCNVWWSLANEYDILKKKTIADWDHYGDLIRSIDPWNHLRSIHNCVPFYDYTKPWVTHCSMQRQDFYVCAKLTDEYLRKYDKPIVLDEIVYEGNIPPMWGNISGQELVRRFWEATVRGGYATHGETYESPDGILWWSHGGVLHGESQERLKFLKNILYETPGYGLRHTRKDWDDNAACAESDPDYVLYYFGKSRPKHRDMNALDPNASYHVEVIDTWDMTIDDRGIMKGRFRLELPGKEYMALRIRKVR